MRKALLLIVLAIFALTPCPALAQGWDTLTRAIGSGLYDAHFKTLKSGNNLEVGVGTGEGGNEYVGFEEGLANEPRMRVNSATDQLEYRDQNEAGWSSLDGLGVQTQSFKTWNAPAGTDPVADSNADTMTVLVGTGMTVTGDESADSLTVAVDEPGLTLSNIGGQVLDAQIAAGAVDGGTAGEIEDGTITSADLADGAVADTKIAAGAVDGGTAGEIEDGTITSADLGTDSVGADEIVADVVGASELGPDVVSGTELADIVTLDAPTKWGDGGSNYRQDGTDGSQTYAGAARPGKTWFFRADAFDNKHANVTQGAAGGFTNYPPQMLEFADANDMAVNYARLSFFMPEDFDASKDCEVEIHAFSDTANAGAATVRIQLKSLARGNSDPLDTALGNAVGFNVTPDATAKDLLIHTQTYADGFAAGQFCIFEIARDGDDATNDTFAASLKVTAVILRYWRTKLSQE